MKKVFVIFVFVCAPIFLGAFLYYVYCPQTLFVSLVDRFVGSSFHYPLDMENRLIRLLRFYLFDFIWGWALMAAFAMLLAEEGVSLRILVGIIVFEIFIEVLQLFPGIIGTFDICDIFVEFVAGIIVYKGFLWRFIKNEKE